jgi:ADP-heptose:LPS heptosyltransferase
MRDALNQVAKAYPKYKIMIIQHDSDFDQETIWQIPNCVPIKNIPVDQLTALISICRLVVCPDSSILHMAGIFKKQTLGLYGPTDPRARFYPNQTALCPALEREMKCFPCWYTCPNGLTTWNYFSPELIANAIITELEKTPPGIVLESL